MAGGAINPVGRWHIVGYNVLSASKNLLKTIMGVATGTEFRESRTCVSGVMFREVVFSNFLIEIGNSMASQAGAICIHAIGSVHAVYSVKTVNSIGSGRTLGTFLGTGGKC